jgi:hypothetical protein
MLNNNNDTLISYYNNDGTETYFLQLVGEESDTVITIELRVLGRTSLLLPGNVIQCFATAPHRAVVLPVHFVYSDYRKEDVRQSGI